MTVRNYTTTDLFFLLADDALTTLFGKPRPTDRKDPSQTVNEGRLSPAEKTKSARLMRVNHSGEICAQALYRSQALTARSGKLKNSMIQAAREENDHLLWCEARIKMLDGRKSLLNPILYIGSFVFGATAGLIGDRWNLGFLAETECQVELHLKKHLNLLPANDIRSRVIVQQMKEDEANHATTAIHAGAEKLPDLVKSFMRVTSRLMTMTTHWL
uniref:3-demethoxyubiquinol 3-hydroxylase n=1 Tax=uncultured gamma proteobacterium HF0200_24F15 TaxID=723570 RepID=E7C3Z7_9GAMM|nr:ubiquinone biosynthesis protein COQ7 [uncultured gamma proteobacterium HF0200_24F15]